MLNDSAHEKMYLMYMSLEGHSFRHNFTLKNSEAYFKYYVFISYHTSQNSCEMLIELNG